MEYRVMKKLDEFNAFQKNEVFDSSLHFPFEATHLRSDGI